MKRRYDPLDNLKAEAPQQAAPVETFEVSVLRKALADMSLQLARSQEQTENLKGRFELLERYSKDERLFLGGLLENAYKKNAALAAENSAAGVEVATSQREAHLSAQRLKHQVAFSALDTFRYQLQIDQSEGKRIAAEKECQRLREELARHQKGAAPGEGADAREAR